MHFLTLISRTRDNLDRDSPAGDSFSSDRAAPGIVANLRLWIANRQLRRNSRGIDRPRLVSRGAHRLNQKPWARRALPSRLSRLRRSSRFADRFAVPQRYNLAGLVTFTVILGDIDPRFVGHNL